VRHTIISYTDNDRGSGKYCECGMEYSKDEWVAIRSAGRKPCMHKQKGE
jgi:hypothetical protein